MVKKGGCFSFWPELSLLLWLLAGNALATTGFSDKNAWQDVLDEAKGQTLYFSAWGGSANTNSYIHWAADELYRRYGVELKLVKVDDIAPVVSRVLAEKAAGRLENGSVDLIWINGENFRSMKQNQLLYGPFLSQIPAMAYVDSHEKPTTAVDFGEPVEGMEAPWGMAQLVFIYDSERMKKPPDSAYELLTFAKQNPGRFTYPAPPDFVGVTFLKQLLFELAVDKDVLQKPAQASTVQQVLKPLWRYLDQLHPHLWRKGRTFRSDHLALTPLLDDGEIMISMSFNPAYASSAISNGELPASVKTYVHSSGTLGNSHFLAIPFNSSAKAAAKVAINFFLSPEGQARKADPDIWGDPTVLSMRRLSQADQQRFTRLSTRSAALSPEQSGKAIPELHASWGGVIEKAWQLRYR